MYIFQVYLYIKYTTDYRLTNLLVCDSVKRLYFQNKLYAKVLRRHNIRL